MKQSHNFLVPINSKIDYLQFNPFNTVFSSNIVMRIPSTNNGILVELEKYLFQSCKTNFSIRVSGPKVFSGINEK